MERIVNFGGMPAIMNDSNGKFILPDNPEFIDYGWISENFDGYLTMVDEGTKDQTIWISDIRSKHEHQGNFIKLLDNLIGAGYPIFIPSPMKRMVNICYQYGGFSTSKYDDIYGIHHYEAGKVFTSYYAKSDSLKGQVLIQISNSAPVIDGLHKCSSLIPDWNYIVKPFKGGEFNEEIYDFKYWTQIKDKLPQIAESLKHVCIRSGKNVVLMCYEAPDKFCHRHLAAHYLESYLGYLPKEI